MGRVFSPEEIETGAVPHAANFTAAAEFLLDTIAETNVDDDTPYTVGTLVFGSTTTGTATPRSDLDVLIAYHDDYHKPRSSALMHYRGIFQNIKDMFHVPVESTVESNMTLVSGSHSIDDIFLQTLLTVPEKWQTGMHPARLAMPHNEDWLSVFKQYNTAKDRKLAKALTDNSEQDIKAFQRALELPIALGRKALGVLSDYGFLTGPEQDNYSSSKKIVESSLELLDLPTNILLPFRLIMKIDQDYSELLAATLDGDSTLDTYQNWLDANYLTAMQQAVDYNSLLGSFVIEIVSSERAL